MSRKILSKASGVSERYLAELERGAGNASLLVLRQIAEALSIEVSALVVGRLWGRLDARVAMQLRGGTLDMEWAGEGQPVCMTGPAVTVYEGVMEGAGERQT
jgi:transcriptional regulator with XRE-family HTH domain